MEQIIFTLMVLNMNTFEHPIYKAVCINGFGSGYGSNMREAIEDCIRQVATLVDIHNKLNISVDMIKKEKFMERTEFYIYGLDSWKSSSVQWVELTYDQIMRPEIDRVDSDNKG